MKTKKAASIIDNRVKIRDRKYVHKSSKNLSKAIDLRITNGDSNLYFNRRIVKFEKANIDEYIKRHIDVMSTLYNQEMIDIDKIVERDE